MSTLTNRVQQFCHTAVSSVVWAFAGAAILVPFGVLAGSYYAGVQRLHHGAEFPVLATILHFALCAVAVGAILGAFIRIFDGENPLTAGTPEPAPTQTKVQPGMARPPVTLPPAISARLAQPSRQRQESRHNPFLN